MHGGNGGNAPRLARATGLIDSPNDGSRETGLRAPVDRGIGAFAAERRGCATEAATMRRCSPSCRRRSGLFARPARDFITRAVEDQVTLLVVGETVASGRENALLCPPAHRSRSHLSGTGPSRAGSRRLPLRPACAPAGAGEAPGLDASPLVERIGPLLDRLPEDRLKNEVRDLLGQLAAPPPAGQPSLMIKRLAISVSKPINWTAWFVFTATFSGCG